MAIIHRKIESLKTLIKELQKRDINRFNSISEIVSFNKQYGNEKLKVIENTKLEINQEVISRRDRIKNNKEQLNILVANLSKELNNKRENYYRKIPELNLNQTNIIFRIINKLRHYRLTKKLDYINKNFDKIIQSESKKIKKTILNDQSTIDYILNNKEDELSKKSRKKNRKINLYLRNFKGVLSTYLRCNWRKFGC